MSRETRGNARLKETDALMFMCETMSIFSSYDVLLLCVIALNKMQLLGTVQCTSSAMDITSAQ